MIKDVVAAVIVKDGKVLCLQRAKKEADLDWCFPGGRVEAGETLEEAITREINEETGIVIKPLRILGDKPHPTNPLMRIVYLHCAYMSGEAQNMLADEGENVEWIDIANVPSFVGRDYMPFVHEFFQGLSA